MLPDCHHIFELTSLEKWFKSQAENVEAKSCPSCSKRVSVKLLRFRSDVLEPFADWNTIATMVQWGSAFPKQKLILQLEACLNFSCKSNFIRYIIQLVLQLLLNNACYLTILFNFNFPFFLQPTRGLNNSHLLQNMSYWLIKF